MTFIHHRNVYILRVYLSVWCVYINMWNVSV